MVLPAGCPRAAARLSQPVHAAAQVLELPDSSVGRIEQQGRGPVPTLVVLSVTRVPAEAVPSSGAIRDAGPADQLRRSAIGVLACEFAGFGGAGECRARGTAIASAGIPVSRPRSRWRRSSVRAGRSPLRRACGCGCLQREAPLGEVAEQARDRTRDRAPGAEDEPLGQASQRGSGVCAAELVVGEGGRDPEQRHASVSTRSLQARAAAARRGRCHRTGELRSIGSRSAFVVDQLPQLALDGQDGAIARRTVPAACSRPEVQEVRRALPELGHVGLLEESAIAWVSRYCWTSAAATRGVRTI